VQYSSTHHSRTASTLLDLCTIDDANKLICHEQHDICFLSAHDLISINYNIKIERILRRALHVCDFRSFNLQDFLGKLEFMNWEKLFQTVDVDDKIKIFNNSLLNYIRNSLSYYSSETFAYTGYCLHGILSF